MTVIIRQGIISEMVKNFVIVVLDICSVLKIMSHFPILGERRFKCEYPGCDKAFRHSDNLKVHHRQHTGEKPIICSLCPFDCRQKSSLQWHIKKHHGVTDRDEIIRLAKQPPQQQVVRVTVGPILQVSEV